MKYYDKWWRQIFRLMGIATGDSSCCFDLQFWFEKLSEFKNDIFLKLCQVFFYYLYYPFFAGLRPFIKQWENFSQSKMIYLYVLCNRRI